MDMQISSDQPADDALPFYRPHGNEIALFERAWRNRLPVLIKGPTGCGKTLNPMYPREVQLIMDCLR